MEGNMGAAVAAMRPSGSAGLWPVTRSCSGHPAPAAAAPAGHASPAKPGGQQEEGKSSPAAAAAKKSARQLDGQRVRGGASFGSSTASSSGTAVAGALSGLDSRPRHPHYPYVLKT